MNNQPVSVAGQPSLIQQITPDWQQIALLLLWKLLPATDKTITLTPQDFTDVMAAYPAGPVILFRPTSAATMVGLATLEEAEILAAAYDKQLTAEAQQNAPTSGVLQ